MYAIVKTGGKQYRVEQGQSLLVERLRADEGAEVTLQPLLYVHDSNVVDGAGLAQVSVQARVVGHERGPKLRIVKFKPKRGYRRRTGHRQELTRLEVTEIRLESARPASRAPKPVAARAGGGPEPDVPAAEEAEQPAAGAAPTSRARKSAGRGGARRPAGEGTSSKPAGEGAASEPDVMGAAGKAAGEGGDGA